MTDATRYNTALMFGPESTVIVKPKNRAILVGSDLGLWLVRAGLVSANEAIENDNNLNKKDIYESQCNLSRQFLTENNIRYFSMRSVCTNARADLACWVWPNAVIAWFM